MLFCVTFDTHQMQVHFSKCLISLFLPFFFPSFSSPLALFPSSSPSTHSSSSFPFPPLLPHLLLLHSSFFFPPLLLLPSSSSPSPLLLVSCQPFPLVSVSRQLERKGTLLRLRVEQKLFGKQRAKRTPLYLFVFTDYLIITTRKKE